MDRRSFLKNSTVGVGATAAAATLAAPAYAQGKRTLTMVTSVPEGFAVFDDAAQNFCDRVGAMTCLLYTSPSPRDGLLSRMPSSA